MKKFITSAALLAASTALASAATVTLLPPPSNGITWLTGANLSSDNFGSPSITEANVTTWLSSSAYGSRLLTSGWHAGVANGATGGGTGSTSAENISGISETGFTFTGRKAYGGEYVTATVNLSDLLKEGDVLTDISISFNTSRTDSFSFSIYTWDGTSAKRIGDVSTGQSLVNFSASSLELTSSSTLVAVFNAKSAGQSYAISNLTSSATYTEAIPEPSAFGLLAGVGALAFAVSRRRRSRSKISERASVPKKTYWLRSRGEIRGSDFLKSL